MMMRKWKRKRKMMTTNQKLIIVSVISVVFITIGYAVMNQILNIRGYATIDQGDGMIFTHIDVKENTGAIIESVASVKAKTMINTSVSFETAGTVTFTVSAQNQGNYDAKLIEIQKLESLNNAEPKCIQTSIQGHTIGDSVYSGVVKTFDVTITSTCTEHASKEIEIYFKYQKQETQGGTVPKVPASGNSVEYLKNNKVEDNVEVGGNGFVAIDDTGEITTSTNPREYRYVGPNPDNYVQFNNELWRIIGIFDGQLKIVRANVLDTKMAWDSNNTNDWSKSSLQTYLNGNYYNTIDTSSQQMISSTIWDLGGVETHILTSQEYYQGEHGTVVYSGNSNEWTGKIALMYPSDYGFATSGGSTVDRSSCLTMTLWTWEEDCYNNDWLQSSSVDWLLMHNVTVSNQASMLARQYVYNSGYANYATTQELFLKPSLFLKSTVEFTGGYGTESAPYLLDDGSTT